MAARCSHCYIIIGTGIRDAVFALVLVLVLALVLIPRRLIS